MSKRLQVLLEPREYKTFQEIARHAGISLGEWVRQALRSAGGRHAGKSADEKIRNIRRASLYNLPTADINQMLSEIEKGYLA